MRKVLLCAALVALTAIAVARAATATPAPIATCAYGTDVPGLRGFLRSSVERDADRYAASLTSADAQTRAKARTVFAAAAAAYVYGLPQVSVRATVKHFPRNEVVSVAALGTPDVKTVVSPNNDTAYTVAWLDLTSGPMVVNVPDTGGRFYTFQFLDAFSNAFAYVGSGSTGTKAGAYAIVPPGFSGSLPAGVVRINAPSNTVWLLGRTLVNGAADLPAVQHIQEQYEATPLAAWSAGTRQPPIVLGNYPPTIPKTIPTGVQFIAALNNEMTIDPAPAADGCALSAMAPAGVQIAHPTPAQSLAADLSDESPALPAVASDPVASAAIAAGTAAGAQVIVAAEHALNAASRSANNGWVILGNWIGRYGRAYLGRAVVALDLLGANTPQQTIYPLADTDVTGRVLNGASRYTIRFPKGQLPPVKAFWSLTLYDDSYFLYPNQINRYSIGDRTTGLHYGSDGSLTVYVQHDPPGTPAQRANWLPAPAGVFHLTMRLYQPKTPALRGTWKPPPIEPVLPPRLSALRIAPASFRPTGDGGVTATHGPAHVTYRDLRTGRISLQLIALHGRRAVVVMRFGHRDHAGRNGFYLTGRAHGHALKPGRYRLRAIGGNAAISVAFRIT